MTSKFLIVGTQRTGSQALFNALNLHPDVFCGGEWTQYVPWYRKIATAERALDGDFDEVTRRRPKDRRRLAEKLTPDTPWFGFKILFRSSDIWVGHPRFSPALMVDRLEAFISWLETRSDIHVIQLVRLDSVEWLKSKYVSRLTGQFTNTAYPEDTKTSIPIHRAVRSVLSKQWIDARLAQLAETNQYHRVFYEDFLSNNRVALNGCLNFLGCDVGRLPVDCQFVNRQSKRGASEYIQNYDALLSRLQELQLDRVPTW